MMKKIKWLLLFLLVILIGVGFTFDAMYMAPKRVSVRYETISSDSIPPTMDNVTLLYFSDLHYNGFMDEARFSKFIEQITNLDCDLVLFGGDLFDNPGSNNPSEEVKLKLLNQLKQIKAPLGKFAVYGDHDLQSEDTKTMVRELLNQADFEVLNNRSVKIRNLTSAGINLVGLGSEDNGTLNIDQAYANVSENEFTITLAHTPDTLLQVPRVRTHLMLSGHSHGGQMSIPLLGPLLKMPYAQRYRSGKHTLENTLLDISNGVGTTEYDIRLFAGAEVVVYRLLATKQ